MAKWFEFEYGPKLRSLRGMILYSKVMRWKECEDINQVSILLLSYYCFFPLLKSYDFFLFCFILYTKITLRSCDVTSVCCYFINNCIIIILLLTEYFENTEVEGKRRT